MVTRRDGRAARRAWRTIDAVGEELLCRECFAAVSWIFGAAVGPVERRPPGSPLSASAEALDSGHCNFCGGSLPEQSFDIQLLPSRRTFVRRDVYRFEGHARQFRCCLFCLAWCRSVIYDGGAAMPDAGGLRALHCGPAASVALLERDRQELAQFVTSAGFDHVPLRASAAAHYLSVSGGILFLGTSGSDGATSVLRALDPGVRGRVVLVGRPESALDFAAALELCPAGFVTSPISGSQLEGAFEQAEAGSPPPHRRHHRSGLTAVTEARVRAGFEPFRVEPAEDVSLAEAAWLVRRVSGGRDRLYATAGGAIALQARCAPDATERFAHRLNYLLGGFAYAVSDARGRERSSA